MYHDFGKRSSRKQAMRIAARAAFAIAVFTLCMSNACTAHSQVLPSGDAGGFTISAGGTGSGYYLQYGALKMLGITGFVDMDTRRRIGFEAEGRWLEFHPTENAETANVHAETYSAGPRYHLNFGKFQPYAKGMIGLGEFTYASALGHGSYLVASGGGGLDYHLTHRIYIRAAEVEYQYWPQFYPGAMNSVGVSAGIRVRVF